MLDKIGSSELSYIIGFLQGDGHHCQETRNRGKITIEVSQKDNDILDKIEVVLSNIISVKRRTRIRDTNFKIGSNFCSLLIHDYNFRSAVLPYIPVGKKSDIIEPPFSLPNFSAKDYIRGLIDADGSIGISKENKPFISLCVSSDKIKEFLLKEIEQKVGIKKEINRNKRDNVYNIMLNNEDAILYAKHLYDGSNLYLNRKYDEYLNFNSWCRSVPKRIGKVKKWCIEEDKIALSESYTIEEKVELLNRTKKSILIRISRLKNNWVDPRDLKK